MFGGANRRAFVIYSRERSQSMFLKIYATSRLFIRKHTVSDILSIRDRGLVSWSRVGTDGATETFFANDFLWSMGSVDFGHALVDVTKFLCRIS